MLNAGEASRARILGGLADSIAERGYAATTIADIVRHARVSKRTFYEQFADKEACFLDLYSQTSDELVALIAAAASGDAPWEQRLEAAAGRTSNDSPPSRR
jgi:AcrR family transcriptional regulator